MESYNANVCNDVWDMEWEWMWILFKFGWPHKTVTHRSSLPKTVGEEMKWLVRNRGRGGSPPMSRGAHGQVR